MPPALRVGVFWFFRSPGSYLATPRLPEWRDEYELELRFRPIVYRKNKPRIRQARKVRICWRGSDLLERLGRGARWRCEALTA